MKKLLLLAFSIFLLTIAFCPKSSEAGIFGRRKCVRRCAPPRCPTTHVAKIEAKRTAGTIANPALIDVYAHHTLYCSFNCIDCPTTPGSCDSMCATPVPEQCPQREKAEQRYKNPKLKNHFYGDVGVNGFTNWPSDPEWNDFAYVITRNEVHLQFFTVAADGTLKQRFAKAWQVTITNRFNPGAPVTYNIGHEVESDPTGTITDARPSQTQPNHHVWNVSDGRNLFQIIVHQ